LCTSSGTRASTTRSQVIGLGAQALTSNSRRQASHSRPVVISDPCSHVSQRAAAPSHRRTQPQAQSVQFDEALSVELVVGTLVFLERYDPRVIEAVWRFTADTGHVAFI